MSNDSSSPALLKHLNQIVQTNCNISDARSAADYTLCIYLLKMREYYRWETELPFETRLPKKEIGEWITDRESLWDNLIDSDYQAMEIDGTSLNPFETESINAALLPHGLVYSGGLGNHQHPHFFLGKLHKQVRKNGHTILVSNEEYARDLTAPPAMTLNKTIFIRRESLRRMIWERFEEWMWKKNEGAMSRALEFYDFDTDLNKALESITDHELETVLLHELGEIEAGELISKHFLETLSPNIQWHDMLASLPRSRTEIMARAVRDNLADCLSTLPALLEQQDPASLHFFFGNFSAMRKELFPGLLNAYHQWINNKRLEQIESIVQMGGKHWLDIAKGMLGLFQEQGNQSISDIETLALNNKL
ncbi:MAG: hypothetical protein KAR30_00565 [Gammaproteobacteria bacterium]|nr:hypothetical protein [Gammaproteobacteria bacterium]